MKKQTITIGVVFIFVALLAWLATTNNARIWPVRNMLQYYALSTWWGWFGPPVPGDPGALRGAVQNRQGRPVAGAWILASDWNGVTYRARSNAQGRYRLDGLPADTYWPVAGAAGYGDIQAGGVWGIKIRPGKDTVLDIVLPPEPVRQVEPGQNLALGQPAALTCTRPFQVSATRRQVTFDNAGRPNQPTFYYTPATAPISGTLPVLLAIYPGPADSWECASLPLADAGYAVLAAGPAYSFDLEQDIDELERLLNFVRAGRFPGSDPTRMAILGGSYSSLHVQRLLQRGQNVQAALLLGPPTDLFDMRRRLENGTYVPPFGLDKALRALGFPNRQPLRYWRYSGAYHVRANQPPLAILHSRTDEVVPYQQSELLARNLESAGATFETHFFDGASHYLLAEEGDTDALEIYRITLDFLARHLQ